jgi:dTDP-4-amino-4,6-dideoxygalactose transaminase
VATFSFYPTKNLAAMGDGGAVLARDAAVIERARLLRQYGWAPRFRVVEAHGRNSRLDALQAAVLSARLPYLDANNERRRQVVRRYRAAAPGLAFLGQDDESNVAHHAVVRTPDRDSLRCHLAAAGIGADVHYPYLVQEMPGITTVSDAATPHAVTLRQECLSLPCFPGMTPDEIDATCAALGSWSADGA